MSVIDFARENKFEVRIKYPAGSYCEVHVLDNENGKHEVSVITELEVMGRSGSQIEQIVLKHLNALKDKIVNPRKVADVDVCRSW